MTEREALKTLIAVAGEQADKLKLAAKMAEAYKSKTNVPASVLRDARRHHELIMAVRIARQLEVWCSE